MNTATLTTSPPTSSTCTAAPAGTSTPRHRSFGDLQRDRVADALRIGALGVVIVWHSTMSLFHRNPDGNLSMPNPIGDYHGLWMLTWLFQVMPLFFVVSGSVNASSWERHHRRGGNARRFATHRVLRFATPLMALTAVCLVIDISSRVVVHRGFLSHYLVILVPLWTLGLLVAYAPITPWLDRLWRRYGATTTVALASAVVLSDLVRFHHTGPIAGAASACSTIGVWLFAYHLGWVYRSAVRSGIAATRSVGRNLTLIGFTGLVVTTNIGVYPRSMVATTTDALSNLLPTTVPVMMLAMFQCGLVLVSRPHLAAWCARVSVQRRIDAIGPFALTAYLFHMFVVVAMVLVGTALGIGFPSHPTPTWWATRPLWLAGVVVFLTPVVRRSARLMSAA